MVVASYPIWWAARRLRLPHPLLPPTRVARRRSRRASWVLLTAAVVPAAAPAMVRVVGAACVAGSPRCWVWPSPRQRGWRLSAAAAPLVSSQSTPRPTRAGSPKLFGRPSRPRVLLFHSTTGSTRRGRAVGRPGAFLWWRVGGRLVCWRTPRERVAAAAAAAGAGHWSWSLLESGQVLRLACGVRQLGRVSAGRLDCAGSVVPSLGGAAWESAAQSEPLVRFDATAGHGFMQALPTRWLLSVLRLQGRPDIDWSDGRFATTRCPSSG